MKVYLDNDVVSAIARDDHQSESSAITSILTAYDEGNLDVVTSEITLREIQQLQGPARPRVERVFRLIEKIPIVRLDELVGMNVQIDRYTCINSPIIDNDPMYDALRAAGVKDVDAQHIFVATKQQCGHFLTCDKGILYRAQMIKTCCGIDVQKPSAFVAAQEWLT